MISPRKQYLLFPVLLGLFCVLVVTGFHSARAQGLGNCPHPPFASSETGRPNILIILDHSRSMDDVPRGATESRWNTARRVVKDIIDDFPNVRFGLFRMDGSQSDGYQIISIENSHVRQGGKLLKPVGTSGSEIRAYIDTWGNQAAHPQTRTNLAETLAAAGQYFATVEVAGFHSGEDDSSFLIDNTAHFYDDGIRRGDFIFNTTDGSYGSITVVTNTTVAAPLAGGTDNNWDSQDTYTTVKKTGRGPTRFGYYGTSYHPNDQYSRCHYVTGKLQEGAEPWIDQSHTINSTLPQGFKTYVAIRTYQNTFSDYSNTAAELIDLRLPVPATVYVAYQDGKTLPTWLESYTSTSDTIGTSNSKTFRVYKKEFAPGTVTLGGNRNGSGNADSTYFAFVGLPGGINDCIASNTDDQGRYLDTTSPITNQCQQSFIIFITDGLANYDSDWNIVTNIIGDYDHVGADSNDRYMDDVAKYLYDNDMRSDLPGKQNLITYVVGFFINDTLLANAASKGGGLYFTAYNADALTSSLNRAITDILDRISGGTAVSTITTSAESEGYLTRAKFLPLSWKGFLEAFALPYVEGETVLWEAGQVLADSIALNGASHREIFTYMGSEDIKKREFRSNDSTLIAELKTKWSEPNGDEIADDEIKDMIDFVRGDATNDGGKYRDRNRWFLGDIIYSTPSIVGPPRSFFLENDYQTFKRNNLNRVTMIYLGANDGMLHAFTSGDGSEAWAFIPENIRPDLTNLTLDGCHQYYVDLSPTVFDVWDETWRESTAKDKVWTGWKTVLLGGNRLGGEEYFALDITDPAVDSVSILWDKVVFSGQKSSTIPFVGKVKVREGQKDKIDKWLAIVTSGYDEDAGRTGRIAAVNFTDGSKETIWKEENSQCNELATQAKSGPNVYYTLTSPIAVDSDNDGYLDLIYAGDTEGALWKFYYDYNDTLWKKVKLFATGGQPLTAKPTVAFDDQQNLRIFFGTGKYLIGPDKGDTTKNTYYCIIEKKFQPTTKLEKGSLNVGHYTIAPLTPLGPSDLADITSLRTEGELSNYLSGLTAAKQQAFNDTRDGVGWYFDLDDPAGEPAERVLEESVVVAGVAFFTSFYPNEDICGYGGDARLYAVDYKTGFIAASGDVTTLSADGGGNITERYKELGAGLPSKPVFHRDFGTGLSSIMVQKSDTTVLVETVTLTGKLWSIGSWRTVD